MLAVRFDAPAFLLGPAGAPRLGNLLPGFARLHVLWNVETREMLSDDLVPAVTLDPLGAGVPAGHNPFWIEQEDRVVGYALHEQPEPLLRLTQGFFLQLPVGKVAGDLR